MSSLELVATLFGLANIVLIVRRSVWNYPFALAMVSIYAVIFRDAKLYSDAALQVFFFAVNLYGWWSWGRSRLTTGEITVERLGTTGIVLWIIGSIAAILAWGTMMARFTDASYPYWDASIAMLSVAAQILMTRRYLQNWHWWITVNMISIPLYLKKELVLTAGLYAVFLAIAIWGLVSWRNAGRVR